MLRLTAIAAVAPGGVIGDGEGMLWHLPEDFARFKRVTMGGALLMGRRTYDSIGGALPGRTSIVLTRAAGWRPQAASVRVARDVPEAARWLASCTGPWFCIGGGEIYRLWWPYTTHLDLTSVKAAVAGTVTFPAVDAREWRETHREPGELFDLVTYERRGDAARRALEGLVAHAG